MLAHEVQTAIEQAEYLKAPKVQDEVNLYVPFAALDEDLAMKMSEKVHLDESG